MLSYANEQSPSTEILNHTSISQCTIPNPNFTIPIRRQAFLVGLQSDSPADQHQGPDGQGGRPALDAGGASRRRVGADGSPGAGQLKAWILPFPWRLPGLPTWNRDSTSRRSVFFLRDRQLATAGGAEPRTQEAYVG